MRDEHTGSTNCAVLNSAIVGIGSRSPGSRTRTTERRDCEKADTDGMGKGVDEGDGGVAETGGTGEGTDKADVDEATSVATGEAIGEQPAKQPAIQWRRLQRSWRAHRQGGEESVIGGHGGVLDGEIVPRDLDGPSCVWPTAKLALEEPDEVAHTRL